MHPAPGDDVGPLGRLQEDGRLDEALCVRLPAFDPPDLLLEEVRGVVECVSLDVLGQGDGDRPGLRRVGQDAHRLGEREQDLLRARDPVEEAGDDAEAVRDTHVLGHRVLDVLEDLSLVPRRIVVRRKEQDRQPADGRGRRPGQHVGRAGTDRGGAGHRREPPVRPREPGRGVHHGLLVRGLVERELVAELDERLAQPRHVAVPQDPPHSLNQPSLHAVALAVLGLQVLDERLGESQPDRLLSGIELHRVASLSAVGDLMFGRDVEASLRRRPIRRNRTAVPCVGDVGVPVRRPADIRLRNAA